MPAIDLEFRDHHLSIFRGAVLMFGDLGKGPSALAWLPPWISKSNHLSIFCCAILVLGGRERGRQQLLGFVSQLKKLAHKHFLRGRFFNMDLAHAAL